jgi:amino acid permease
MALSGFLVFSDKTQANILNNFPQDDILINIARLCFGLNMFTTLPLEAFVCREVSPLSTFIRLSCPNLAHRCRPLLCSSC